MCHVDWTAVAAWVQAVGSIGAIVVAIWIGERSSKRARDLVEQERKRQAAIFASTFATRLGLQAQEAEHRAKQATAVAARPTGSQRPDANMLRALFLLPNAAELLEERRECLMFDRESGIVVMTALDVIASYNPTVDTMITMYEFRANGDVHSVCTEIQKRLVYVAEMLREAEGRLEAVHNLQSVSEF